MSEHESITPVYPRPDVDSDDIGVLRAFLARVAVEDRDFTDEELDALENLLDNIARPPGFSDFVVSLGHFLTNYPADVFTGVSGDPGSVFVATLRKALDGLKEAGHAR